jgi:hypothetical protein
VGRDATAPACPQYVPPPGVRGPRSLGGQTVLIGRPLIVENIHLFQEFSTEPALVASGTRSTFTAPVRAQGGAAALLGVFDSRRRLFTPEEAEFLWGLAGEIAAALYREAWRNQLTLGPLRGTTNSASGGLDPRTGNSHDPRDSRDGRGPER